MIYILSNIYDYYSLETPVGLFYADNIKFKEMLAFMKL